MAWEPIPAAPESYAADSTFRRIAKTQGSTGEYYIYEGLDRIATLATKSVTAPIAMGIAEQLGGSPTLAAVFTMCTGIVGAIVATPLLNAIGLKDWAARGFAAGVAAHGMGTARAWSLHPRAGAYASLAMGLHGILGALLLPLLARFLTP